MEAVLISILALFAALFTAPGAVFLMLWTLFTVFLTWRWVMHKAATAPEWFAKRNAQSERLEAGAREFWSRVADRFERAREQARDG